MPWSSASAQSFMETLGRLELDPLHRVLKALLKFAENLSSASREYTSRASGIAEWLDREDARIAAMRESKASSDRNAEAPLTDRERRHLRGALDRIDTLARSLREQAGEADSVARDLEAYLLLASAASAAQSLAHVPSQVAAILDEVRDATVRIDRFLKEWR